MADNPNKDPLYKEDKNLARIRLLVYPRFQLGLITANLVVMTAAIFFVIYEMRRAIESLKEMGVASHIPADHAYFRFLEWQMGQFNDYLAFAYGMAFFLSVTTTLVLSNRLAGPIIRLNSFFKKIAENGFSGELIRFRKGDFFSYLPDIINKALARIKEDKATSSKDKAA
ncbi:MAG: hypothetical protein AB7F43_11460 [Bacteriovoracia bacterium]